MQEVSLDEIRRLLTLRAEMLRLLTRPDRPRAVITWLKWRSRAERRRQRGVEKTGKTEPEA
ncbi:hypothetical protein GCM10007857_43990 [Bradyrhizobium iriomotense]|uniref:50S ribosomal protein L29 n=1 Tax=Bradyrhizobium iriomotense TaxID=441950 RepID=A0ABQ6B0L0_9BRAD|nr:hypothetical protein GCM10007857_43990 [Bradyrhizobium iriomotense]